MTRLLLADDPLQLDSPTEPLRFRIDASSQDLGLAPPPCTVQAWLLASGDRLRLMALSPPGRAPHVAAWLAGQGITQTRVEPGLAPRSLWAELDTLPAAWRPFLADRAIQRIELTPEGTVSLFVEDIPGRAHALVAKAQAEATCHVRETLLADPGEMLTSRQKEALAVAVALGYYEVPRRTNLRELARAMGMSAGAASELLRRGERTLVSAFFDSGHQAAWAWDRQA